MIISLLLSSCKHFSLLGLIATGPCFPILTSKGLRRVSVDCCHLFCLLAFAWENQHYLFFHVLWCVSVPRTQLWFSPITFFIKSNIFIMVLQMLHQLKGSLLFANCCHSSFALARVFGLGGKPICIRARHKPGLGL